jgi:hypothetical protein
MTWKELNQAILDGKRPLRDWHLKARLEDADART